MLTDFIFTNINQIKLKQLFFEFDYGVTGSFDYIRILQNIQPDIRLSLKHSYHFDSCSLCFANVPIKIIQSNYQDPLIVHWKMFTFYVEIDKLSENFWFSTSDTYPIINGEETFIHFKISKEYNFDCCKLIDESVAAKTYNTKFPKYISMAEWEFIIPMRYLISADYGSESIFNLISHIERDKFINEISKAPKVLCSIKYSTELLHLNECRLLFPHKCWFSISEYSRPDNYNELDSYIQSKLDTSSFEDF